MRTTQYHNIVTAYNSMNAGTIMNAKRDEIMAILDDSGLSVLHKIFLLDMMAQQMKFDALVPK